MYSNLKFVKISYYPLVIRVCPIMCVDIKTFILNLKLMINEIIFINAYLNFYIH